MTDGAEIVKAAVDRPRRLYGRCEFCGNPCYGRTCHQHRDLLANDPHQQLRSTTAGNDTKGDNAP